MPRKPNYKDLLKKFKKRNKKEQTTSEKLQEKLEPLSPCPMSDE